jgi:hypothetical protein
LAKSVLKRVSAFWRDRTRRSETSDGILKACSLPPAPHDAASPVMPPVAAERDVSTERRRRRSLRVVVVSGRRAREHFIRLPWSIYRDDPAWVAPLLAERRHHLSPRRPYFQHAVARFWLAYRDGEPVGRISAQIDRLHLERHGDDTGLFGMLEAENDPQTFQALLDAAEEWLGGHGLRRVLGPFNLSINEECGLLLEGFETPPMIMMGHARRYYDARIEEHGYEKAKDLLAYRITDFRSPDLMRRVVASAADHVRVRPLRRSRLAEELQILHEIFDDAWAENWGFIPFTASEFDALGRTLRFLVRDDFVQIAEVEGVPSAMLLLLPNLNELIRDLDGRLLPFGWLRLLWRLKRGSPRTARVALMGVRKQYQRSPLGLALAFSMIEAVRRAGSRQGVEEVELSWILEDNTGMRNILAAIGSRLYKRYRIYQKMLA